jgi:hypothetical protein
MSLLKIWGRGFGTAVRTSRVLVYLWPIDFVFALLVVSPAVFLIWKDFGRSLSGESVDRFRFLWLGDLVYKYSRLAPALVGLILLVGLIYVLVSLFLNGGIIGRIAAPGEKIRLANFCADCGRYFWRFVRVFLWTLVGYALVLGVVMRLVSVPFDALVRGAPGEWSVIIVSNLQFLILVLVLSIVQMFFDYVKIRLVVENSRRVWRGVLSTASFVAKNFFRAWVLYLFVGIFFWAASFAFLIAANRLPPSWGALGLGFVWAQLYVLFRLWIKVLFFGTEYHFVKERGQTSSNPIPNIQGGGGR